MLGAGIIVFREVLEASLIIAIVLGATRGVAHRGRWVAAGIAAGLAGAFVVAAFAGSITEAFQGRGQELLYSGILLSAVMLLAWHNIWMHRHGCELALRMREVGQSVRTGTKPLSALAVIAGLAVLREGTETVLFLFGLGASGAGQTSLMLGALLGLAAGAASGALVYYGIRAIPLRHFFAVTAWMVTLIAAGMAANAAGLLHQAGLLPALLPRVWDTSAWLSQTSLAGTLLHILIGYQDRPTGIQLVFYGVTVVLIFLGMGWAKKRPAEYTDKAAST